MSRIAYVNGRYERHADAGVHIEDRGYQFADGVYEAFEVNERAVIDVRRHLDRLERSLAFLEIPMPLPRAALIAVLRETIRRNRVVNGLAYMQVTRGVAPRDHAFPAKARPSLVITSKPLDRAAADRRAATGVAAITLPDNRWERVDIKTIGLLPNVLAKQAARRAGAFEALFYDREGLITEGSSTNAWIVTADNRLVTRPASTALLDGITRFVIRDVAAAEGLEVEMRAFSVEEARAAREVFITAASTLVMPITSLDGQPIANGHPGSIAGLLRSAFHRHAERTPL